MKPVIKMMCQVVLPKMLPLWVLCVGLAWSVPPPIGWAQLLEPSEPGVVTQVFHHTLDALDPTETANPKGALLPGFRGENQMVLYSPAFGPRTQTNSAGTEAVMIEGQVLRLEPGNSLIPQNGYILSGHGTAAQWVQNVVKPGAKVSLHPEQKRITIENTPEVYHQQVAAILERALSRPPANKEAFERHIAATRHCLSAMREQPERLTRAFISQAEACEREAHRALYQTFANNPSEFRGVWLRPSPANTRNIEQTLDALAQLNIRHIYLETYYQGKTIFSSQTMEAYGLPAQHAQFQQFKDTDPLQLWIEKAHARGIQVHAWVQVFFAGNAVESIEAFGPILQKYPQWRNVQRTAMAADKPVPSTVESGHYFLDPANPEVRSFVDALLTEIVTRYPVDGLNLDYIRYPASASVTAPHYLGTTWGYTPSAQEGFLAMLKEKNPDVEKPKAVPAAKAPPPKTDPFELTPTDPYWDDWVTWRKDCVTSLVKATAEKARQIRPGIQLSAVVFPAADAKLAWKLQDWPRWAKEGYIDALTPIGLSPTPDGMYQHSKRFREMTQDKVPVYVGVFGMYNRLSPEGFLRQLEGVRRAEMPGVVLFEWSKATPQYIEALQEGPFRP